MKRKFYALYSLLAAVLAFSMLAAGCKSNNDPNGEPSETVSVNVIGGDASLPELDDEHVYVTDAEGGTVTGAGGSAITQPVVTADTGTFQTLSDQEILDAMTATTPPPQLNISETTTAERYAYATLTDEEKQLYDAIVNGVENLRYKICPEDAFTMEEWSKIYGMVYNQEPRLFYMAPKIKVGKLYYLTKDPDAINQMQQSIDATVNKILAEASGKSSTADKLLVFHDYLVLNSTFEKLEESTGYNSSIYNAFGSGADQGSIQCAGYAKAMQYLCDRAGIRCMVVTGEKSTGESHAWNVVDVDGAWYNLDTTWDDPILTTPNIKNLRHNYFLVPDKWIHNISHIHISQKKLSDGSYLTYFTPPACTETSQNYFIKNGLVYNDKDSADKAIRAEIKKAAENGTRTAQIMVGSSDVYDAIYGAKLDYNNYAKEFSGIKGVGDECNKDMLLIEFDVISN